MSGLCDVILVWDHPACVDRGRVALMALPTCVALCFSPWARAALLEARCDPSRVVLIDGARNRASAVILAYLQYIEPCKLNRVLVPVPMDGAGAIREVVDHVVRRVPRYTAIVYDQLEELPNEPPTEAELSVLSCECTKHLALWQAHPPLPPAPAKKRQKSKKKAAAE